MAYRRRKSRRRSSARRSAKVWKRRQSRAGLRMSSKGWRKARRTGRARASWSTFKKFRRKARNPQATRNLADGGTVTLTESGADGIVRAFDAAGELVYDKRAPLKRALGLFKRYKASRSFSRRAHSEGFAMLAADNPARRRWKNKRRSGGRRRGRKACRGRKAYKPRWKSKRCRRSISRGRGRSKARSRRGRSKARRNPAQFPTPFASAMNPRIRGREARAMRRVLKRHGYGCRR